MKILKNEVAIFSGSDEDELQELINDFFQNSQESEFKVIDIKFSSTYCGDNDIKYSALIQLENFEPDTLK